MIPMLESHRLAHAALFNSVRLRTQLYLSASVSYDLPRSEDYLPAKLHVSISFWGHFDIRFPLVMRPSSRHSPCLVSHSFPSHGIILHIYNRPCPSNISPKLARSSVQDALTSVLR